MNAFWLKTLVYEKHILKAIDEFGTLDLEEI